MNDCGVVAQPDVKKTSFEELPGLVVLGTGGLWGVIPDGAAVLSILSRAGVRPGSREHRKALMALSGLAQKIWSKEEGEEGMCDDVTCMLLHWHRPGPHEGPPGPAGRGVVDIDSCEAANLSPPEVTTGLRTKPTTCQPSLSLREVEALCNKAHLVQPDPALGHPDIVAQVVSCVEAGEPFDMEKPVWFSEKGEPRALRLDNVNKEWLSKFQASNIKVATLCRKGRRHGESHDPNQDSYSITSATRNRAVYVVCDGHGSHGHLASFRVAQSLPMLVLKGLSLNTSEPPENVLSRAIREANADLESFGRQNGLDFSDSGTSCSVALRLEDRAFVGWLGDCGALVATVMGQHKKVDFMSKPHLPSEDGEFRHLSRSRLAVKASADDMARVYCPGQDRPGLSISRTLGDFMVMPDDSGGGVTCEAEITKTTFGARNPPGLVLLGSGGACEYFDDSIVGEDMLGTMGPMLQKGPDLALKSLCHASQERWKAKFNDYCEDVSAILIQWVGDGQVASGLPSVVQHTTLPSALAQPRALDPNRGQPRVVQASEISPSDGSPLRGPSALATTERAQPMAFSPSRAGAAAAPLRGAPIQGQELTQDRVSQAPGWSLPSTSQAAEAAAPMQGEPRKFLQAQPRSGAASAANKTKVALRAPPANQSSPADRRQEPDPSSIQRANVAEDVSISHERIDRGTAKRLTPVRE